MMKTFFKRALPSLLVVLAGFLMTSCRSKIDMDNVDTTTELDLGLAVPVGYLHITMGDLIEDADSGPIVIGQGCEFDYSGVQACKVLRRDGYEVVLVNSNPATIMTDPEMADRKSTRLNSSHQR